MSHSYTNRPSAERTRPSAPTIRSRSARKAPVRGMTRGAPRGGLRDLPGVSRGQQLGDVAGAALRDGLLFLLENEVLVDRRFDGREHADRNREVGREKIGEELGGVHVRLVMNPEGKIGRASCRERV